MSNDMTTAMTDAYFRKPPKTDWIYLTHHKRWPHGYTDHSKLLACRVDDSPWRWNAEFGALIHRHTGVLKMRTGSPPKKSAEPFFDVRVINAEVGVQQTRRDWMDAEIDYQHPTVADTKPVPPEPRPDMVAVREHATDPAVWHEVQKDLKRPEQKRRAKGYHPSMRNVNPRDHMTDEDRANFYRLAREVMANLCHLTHFLPQCKILASKLAISMLEAVEWREIGVTEWGQNLTKKIDEELRAVGSPHGPARLDGSDSLTVDRLEQQREGGRFQYHFLRLLFKAWSDQLVDVELEYGGLMQSTNHYGRLGIESYGNIEHPRNERTGSTSNYVPVLLRQHEKKTRKRDVAMRSEVHRAALIGKTPAAFAEYYEKHTGFKPRKGRSVRDQATPEVAQPMSESEAGWMDDDAHHAGYVFDDDGNVVD